MPDSVWKSDDQIKLELNYLYHRLPFLLSILTIVTNNDVQILFQINTSPTGTSTFKSKKNNNCLPNIFHLLFWLDLSGY